MAAPTVEVLVCPTETFYLQGNGYVGISKILRIIFSGPGGLGLLFLSLPSLFSRIPQGYWFSFCFASVTWSWATVPVSFRRLSVPGGVSGPQPSSQQESGQQSASPGRHRVFW